MSGSRTDRSTRTDVRARPGDGRRVHGHGRRGPDLRVHVLHGGRARDGDRDDRGARTERTARPLQEWVVEECRGLAERGPFPQQEDEPGEDEPERRDEREDEPDVPQSPTTTRWPTGWSDPRTSMPNDSCHPSTARRRPRFAWAYTPPSGPASETRPSSRPASSGRGSRRWCTRGPRRRR